MKAINTGRLKWWREAKFGIFIHWGLYSVLEGEWKGERCQSDVAQIMHRMQIPITEYEPLADEFNPVKFDADQWVKLAKDAGMKYLVITSKHHDGFAMYASTYDDYNIVDRTPFGRDPMKELAEACHKYGIKFCFYYSLGRDWYHPEVPTEHCGWRSNTWDFPDEKGKDVSIYFNDKVKKQVTELLTNYGPIGLLWFDTPELLTKGQSKELVQLVRQLQPDCIINGRVGNDEGDYIELADNEIPETVIKENWETPTSVNNSWGFNKFDYDWKSPKTLLTQLANVVGRGGNYLLNVGPTPEGLIPEPAIERLNAVGKWLSIHGDAIYGAMPGPFNPKDTPWGTVTAKPGKLYLLIDQWPKEIKLKGLTYPIKNIYMPVNAEGDKAQIALSYSYESGSLKITLPEKAPDTDVSIAVIEHS